MSILYIIGNGFDLYHGLPTSYKDFYEFGKDLLDEIEEFYKLDISSATPWSDFEKALGEFDWKSFYDFHNHIDVDDEGFRPSFVSGLHDDIAEQTDHHVKAIRGCFQQWIDDIEVLSATKTLSFAENARFISFNYTSTLQDVYCVDDINLLHIHGCVKKYDELIFGHGETMKEESEFDKDGEPTRTMFTEAEDAAKYPFYALKKPVDDVLDEHKEFFDSLKDLQEIIILGHSINKIDWPYFEKISRNAPNARWTYCLRDDERMDEEIQYIYRLNQCGVLRDKIRFTRYAYLTLQA